MGCSVGPGLGIGAIGAFGLQGLEERVCQDLAMQAAVEPYRFRPGEVYNVDGSQFICHKEGVGGAHSDIAGPEVAHLLWQAAMT
jgi:hypothetical protein